MGTYQHNAPLSLIYTIKIQNNWKLFLSKLGPPYPSRWTHLSGLSEVGRVETHKNRKLGDVSVPNQLFFSPSPDIPAQNNFFFLPVRLPAGRNRSGVAVSRIPSNQSFTRLLSPSHHLHLVLAPRPESRGPSSSMVRDTLLCFVLLRFPRQSLEGL